MSIATPSHDFNTASQTAPGRSLPTNDERETSHPPITALAIEAQHAKFGCAVFVEEEQQLLLCEDLSCDFAFDDRDQPDLMSVPAPNPIQARVNTGDGHGNNNAHLEQRPSGRDNRLDTAHEGGDDNTDGATSTFSDHAFGFIESLLAQFKPDLIVVSSRCPESFLVMLQHHADQRNSTLQVRSARDFQMTLGLSSIEEATALTRTFAASSVTSGYTSVDDGIMSGLVVLDAKVATAKSPLSIAAVGPLLSSLRSKRDIGRSLTLVSLCLGDYLFLDENSLKSLSICSSDVHGFVHAKEGREGHAESDMLQKRWIMLPLAKRNDIRRRHEAVELLVRQESSAELIAIRQALTELGGLPQLCFKLNQGVGTVFSWEKLYKTCNAVLKICSALNGLELAMSGLISDIRFQLIIDPFLRLADKIQEIIDFAESKNKGKVTVKAGLDERLDTLRETEANLPSLLNREAANLRSNPAFRPTNRINVVYFPQIGYLIVVPAGEVVDMIQDPSLEKPFETQEYVYLRNSRMEFLSDHLGDIASYIADREIEILDELYKLLEESSSALLSAHAALSQLDCLIAFARAATLYDLRRPTLVEEQVVRLKGSRHALKALSDESFVPNDIELQGGVGLQTEGNADDTQSGQDPAREAEDEGQQASITQGPAEVSNKMYGKCSELIWQKLPPATSGASGCGSFVPATRAELGVFDRILTRMRQDESVASEGSSFTRELGRLHRAMSMSTKRSLVVLDEVGRECRSDDGAGLFIATIDEFLQRGQDCPVVLSATHHLRESPQLASLNYRSYAFTESSVFAFRNEQERSKDISRTRSQFNERTCKLSSFRPLPTYTTLSPTSTGSNQALLAPPTHWHDSEAMRDEAIVRRLLQLQLGNDVEEGGDEQQMSQQQQVMKIDDEEARKLIHWILCAQDNEMQEEGAAMQGE
ncbi:related to MutS protein homolog 5 [Ustilago sp. UG-2017b]|nr:related to MutS protein homolog 5 [Ustilago sp. UG-2017b]